ncbi:hypothetical protein D3C78_1417380 [compost metagenome]
MQGSGITSLCRTGFGQKRFLLVLLVLHGGGVGRLGGHRGRACGHWIEGCVRCLSSTRRVLCRCRRLVPTRTEEHRRSRRFLGFLQTCQAIGFGWIVSRWRVAVALCLLFSSQDRHAEVAG